jgi:group I intron endonuclease
MSLHTADRRSGIYEILCSGNGVKYIGSATDLRSRAYGHRHRLVKGNHHSAYMQRAWNKYGAGAFSFRVLLVCAVKNLEMYEQGAINAFRPGFNSNLTAQVNTGGARSDTFKQECRDRLTRQYAQPGAKQRQSERIKKSFAAGVGSMAGVRAMANIEVRARAASTLNARNQTHQYRGEFLSCVDVQRKYAVPKETFRQRVRRGWSVSKAIETPVDTTKHAKRRRGK